MSRFMARWFDRARAAGWSGRVWWQVRRQLRRCRLADVAVGTPPRHPSGHGRGSVLATLAVLRASCLERAVVVQQWDAADGRERDLLIGVSRAGGRTLGHAWLEGENPRGAFSVIHRLPAPAAARAGPARRVAA